MPAGAAFFLFAFAEVDLGFDLDFVEAFVLFLAVLDFWAVLLDDVALVLEACELVVVVLCAKLEAPARAKLRLTKPAKPALRRGKKIPARIPSALISIKTIQIIYLARIVKPFIY
ncbi:hypothetical protein [Zwartia vadi]|uniref:hypothetical protein n=1 Tax=Zwartia vadi TaxID=3058168 RepID=UPI0025B3C0AF|nr:hypothetical protein [Zwartia vadi]MDN3988621.1 hypothetical protein [Zwartia vadi]